MTDGIEEGVLAMLVVEPKATPRQFVWPAPPDDDAAPLGVTSLVHLATSLRLVDAPGAEDVATRQAAAEVPPKGAIVLPPPQHADAPLLETIAARRSVRRFERTPLTLEELSSMLDGVVGAVAPPLSDAVRVHVICHAMENVDAGAYAFEPSSHALLPNNLGDLRAASASTGLAQDLVGDAAVVFILTLDRSAVFEADGARGYRHGFLQAGMLGERIYLEAGGRGLGACAVGAFYDEEAARLIGVDPAKEWVVHFAAVGRPDNL